MTKRKWSVFLAIFFTLSKGAYAQGITATISGIIKNNSNREVVAYANIVLKKEKDSAFVSGTVSAEDGRFSLAGIRPGSYILQFSYTGYYTYLQPALVGSLNSFYDLGVIDLQPDTVLLKEVLVNSRQEDVSNKMDKKSFAVADNISQSGGSVLQALKNLPGVTSTQEGKVELRGAIK